QRALGAVPKKYPSSSHGPSPPESPGSQVSPIPLLLASRWSGFGTVLQLSKSSGCPSASVSAQARPKRPAARETSVMSTKLSPALSGAMSLRTEAGGTLSPKLLVRLERSLMSVKPSSATSGGQEQRRSGSVPTCCSRGFEKP